MHTRVMNIRSVVIASLLAAGLTMRASFATSSEVPYPDGFRRWAHIKSSLSAPKSDADQRAGIHHIYANELALRGYETGHFPEGSVIVFDLLAVSTANGTTKETGRKLIDVMHKDSTRFGRTGGWGYEEFRGDTRVRVVRDRAPIDCFQCHTQRKDHDYVFSGLRP
jgi:hypothetical protein